MRRAILLLPIAILAGCGGGKTSSAPKPATTVVGSKGGAPGTGTPVRTLTVHEREFSLAPSSFRLSKPGTYTFKGINGGTIQHALALSGNGINQQSKAVGPGQTTILTVTLTKPGNYELYCPIGTHRAQGMTALVALAGARGSGGTGSTQTQTQTQPTTTSGGGGYGRGY